MTLSLSRLCHGQTASCQPGQLTVIGTRGSPISGTRSGHLPHRRRTSHMTPQGGIGQRRTHRDVRPGDRADEPSGP